MAKQPKNVPYNKAIEFGQANSMRLLATNEQNEITVGKNRVLFSVDLTADLGKTKSNKTYLGQINREAIKLGNDIYDINFYMLKRETNDTEEKPTKEKFINEL